MANWVPITPDGLMQSLSEVERRVFATSTSVGGWGWGADGYPQHSGESPESSLAPNVRVPPEAGSGDYPEAGMVWVLTGVLSSVVGLVHGFIRASGNAIPANSAPSPQQAHLVDTYKAGLVPPELVSAAYAVARFDLLSRFPLEIADHRKVARDGALDLLRQVADGKVQIENTTGGGADPLVPSFSAAYHPVLGGVMGA